MTTPMFGLGVKGKSPTVSSQRHLNLYAEIVQDPEKGAQAVYYGTPGTNLFTTFGDTPVRGGKAINDFIYYGHRGTIWEVNNAGVKTSRGVMGTTTGRVQMDSNGQQLGIVDGSAMYVYNLNRTAQTINTLTHAGTTATLKTLAPHLRYTGETITVSGATPAAYNGTFAITVVDATTLTYTMLSDPGVDASVVGSYAIASSFVPVTSGLFANPIDITFQDGYFICCFKNSGQFQVSAAYNGTVFDPLNYATAESNPDNLVRIIADHSELTLCGEKTVEFWTNTGGQAFQYSRIPGATLEFGLAAPWSLVKYNDSLAGLFKNNMGQVQVMMMRGHSLMPLSSQEHSAVINRYATVADATAFAYMLGGHPMYQISFPSAGKSWLFDATTNLWSEMQTGLADARHIAEIHVDYQNKPRVTDYATGNVYTLDPAVYTDNGTPIVRELISRHYFMDYVLFFISRLTIDFQTGVGLVSGQGSNPMVSLSISKDNGNTWGNELWTSIGAAGGYLARAFWTRLGCSRDWLFKFRITDAVKIVITGGKIDGMGS